MDIPTKQQLINNTNNWRPSRVQHGNILMLTLHEIKQYETDNRYISNNTEILFYIYFFFRTMFFQNFTVIVGNT